MELFRGLIERGPVLRGPKEFDISMARVAS
jgi:hypothetical protein